MNYRNRIRRLENRLRSVDKSGSYPIHNNSGIADPLIYKISEVKDQLMNHYKSNCAKNTFRSYESSFTNLIRVYFYYHSGTKCIILLADFN